MKALALSLLFVSAFLAGRAHAEILFDEDSAHAWNRLYAAMQAEAPTPSSFSPNRREVFPDDQKYDELIRALDSFIRSHAEKLISAPAKRAVLQSLLWATFDQASDPLAAEQPRREQVARRCAEIMRRLALTGAGIAALPDNYSATLKSRMFPEDYDAEHRDAAFLPAGLLDASGPWVMMSGEWPDPAAIQHVRAVKARSQFYVFIRLPGGRTATLEYLRALANYPQPYIWNPTYKDFPYAKSPVGLNPALPQFPKGTAVALLRLMVLPDSNGELRITPIVESLQLRVYAKDPLEAKCCGEPGDQDFFVFHLDAASLFQGKAGLKSVPLDEHFTPLIFEVPTLLVGSGACRSCHGDVGVRGFQTYARRLGPPRQTPWFEPATISNQDRNTLDWKKRDYSWGLLRGMLWTAPARR
jgi:hypothetical protein